MPGPRRRWASIRSPIFTRADSLSLHTKLAGSAREIGGDAVRGYLDIEAVIAAAKASGSDCVHPGYGFLSENTLFAERCKAEGLRFIGPSPASLKLFGDKVEARAFAQAQGIPVIPGAPKLASSDEAKAKAKAIGYPVMLKASAGGGGRGMRAVTRPEEMDEAFARCQGEAEAAFGDRALFLEKIVPRPRHIEVQVLGDGQGNVVHLFERDCSVQLRNQKVVEVAPAPNLDEGLRQRILADAVKLARAARYENAGTVEFLVNPETGEHFFIECNPRIQVEHTITEQVMGFDLVEAQFRIAAGASLAALGLADQKAVGTPRGFAVQARRRGAGHRHAQRLSRAVRPRRARRCLRLCRAGAAAAVRSAARQADLPVGLLGLLRLRRRPHAARARRVPYRRRADQRRPAARDPGASRVPRRQRADDAARRGDRAREGENGSAAVPRPAGRQPRARPRCQRRRLPAHCRCRPGTRPSKARMRARSSTSRRAKAPR